MSFIDSALGAANDIVGDLAVPYALIAPTSRYIGTIYPDVTVREVHADEFTITVHPVETGTPISDHVFANPKIIEIECGFSDSTGGYTGYVQDAYQSFLTQAAQREPFDVSTGKRLYNNMLFGNITVVTDVTSEFALMVTVRLQEVIITSTNGGSGLSQANQGFPSQTSPSTDAGTQTLQSTSGAVNFNDYMTNFGGGVTLDSIGPGGIGSR